MNAPSATARRGDTAGPILIGLAISAVAGLGLTAAIGGFTNGRLNLVAFGLFSGLVFCLLCLGAALSKARAYRRAMYSQLLAYAERTPGAAVSLRDHRGNLQWFAGYLNAAGTARVANMEMIVKDHPKAGKAILELIQKLYESPAGTVVHYESDQTDGLEMKGYGQVVQDAIGRRAVALSAYFGEEWLSNAQTAKALQMLDAEKVAFFALDPAITKVSILTSRLVPKSLDSRVVPADWMRNWVHPNEFESIRAALRACVADKCKCDLVLRARMPGTRDYRLYVVNAVPVEGYTHDVASVLCIARDVTDETANKAELARRSLKARASTAMLQGLTTAAKAASATIGDFEAGMESLGGAADAAEISLGFLARKTDSLELRTQMLDDLVSEVLVQYQSEFEAANVTLRIHVDENQNGKALVALAGPPTMFQKALHHLLKNTVSYLRARSFVDVSIKADPTDPEHYLLLEIQDEGPGITDTPSKVSHLQASPLTASTRNDNHILHGSILIGDLGGELSYRNAVDAKGEVIGLIASIRLIRI